MVIMALEFMLEFTLYFYLQTLQFLTMNLRSKTAAMRDARWIYEIRPNSRPGWNICGILVLLTGFIHHQNNSFPRLSPKSVAIVQHLKIKRHIWTDISWLAVAS